MNAGVGDRPSDWDGAAGCTALAKEPGDGDRGLGGAVLVPQLGVQRGQEVLSELERQHFAAARYRAQSDAIPNFRLGEESPQCRWREMHRGDGLLDHGPDEVGGVLVDHRVAR